MVCVETNFRVRVKICDRVFPPCAREHVIDLRKSVGRPGSAKRICAKFFVGNLFLVRFLKEGVANYEFVCLAKLNK